MYLWGSIMKNIIPVIIIGTSLLGGVNLAYAAKTDPNVWADSDSKEWGNTPESVKYVLSNVQISRSQGNNGNNKQTDLFSTKWLKEMQRSPSTYRLTESDKKWVDNVLANAEARNSNTWKPSNKTPTAPKPKVEKSQPAVKETATANSVTSKPVETVKKEVESKIVKVKSKEPSIMPTGTGLTKEEMDRQVSKITKAESKPLPSPKIEAKEKPDLTPVKTQKAEVVKEDPLIEKNKEEKPELSEMDKFIATLPVVTSDDLPISEIDQTKEEMADFREMYSEQRIKKALEDEALKQDAGEALEDSINQSLNNNTSFEVKPFNPLPENEHNAFEIKPFESSQKNDDKGSSEKVFDNNKPVINNDIIKTSDNSWMMSALSSLIAIAVFMFGIVLYTGRKLKDSGKLDKYI